jgi:ADP-ribose pyrophosphatase YjhB (NUDIX family)
MIESAGLLILQDNKMLLAHPTRAPWYGTYTIPKGKVENGESYLDAALRETKEEVGIDIDTKDIDPNYKVINYTDSKNRIYKKVMYFIAKPSIPIEIDKSKLDKREVNWVGFVDKDDAMDRIFWRFAEMMDYLD